jgi:hypothetical protein
VRAIGAFIAIVAIIVASALLHSSAVAGASSYEQCVIEEMRGQSIFMETYVREFCTKRFPQPATPPTAAPQAVPPAGREAMIATLKEVERAFEECKAERASGKLPTYEASAQCSNPRMIRAFNAVHYKYMGLIQFFAAKRLEVATKIDRGEMTEQQGQVETQNIYASIQATERQRDAAAR